MIIEQVVAARLLAWSAIAALVGTRVEPVVIHSSSMYDTIVYRRLYGQRDYNLTGAEGVATVQLELMSWSQEYASARTLADEIRKALDAWSSAADDVEIASVTDGADTWEPDLEMYGCPVNLTIKYQEA